jgi:hypothetical protein
VPGFGGINFGFITATMLPGLQIECTFTTESPNAMMFTTLYMFLLKALLDCLAVSSDYPLSDYRTF